MACENLKQTIEKIKIEPHTRAEHQGVTCGSAVVYVHEQWWGESLTNERNKNSKLIIRIFENQFSL